MSRGAGRCAPAPACAALAGRAVVRSRAAPVSEETVHEIGAQLRCVVCQSLSVADSPSETANQMRGIIRERLAAGDSPEQVQRLLRREVRRLDPARRRPGRASTCSSGSCRSRRLGAGLACWSRRWCGAGAAGPPAASRRPRAWTPRCASASIARWPSASRDRGSRSSLIAAIGVPALAIVLWPLLGGRAARPRHRPRAAPTTAALELDEEKSALYRALRELEFDHDAGHLSDADYQSLRERYESPRRRADHRARCARPGAAAPRARGAGPRANGAPRASWTRHPATFAAGAVVLVVFGVVIGVNVGRFTERDETFTPPGAGSRCAGPPAVLGRAARWPGREPGKPIPPEMLAGMLQAARQSLFEGRYAEAIAAYQAVLKRDERNVDAMTHLGLIVAIGGHADSALETFDKALKIDPEVRPRLPLPGPGALRGRSRTTRARWWRGSASWRWRPRPRTAIASRSCWRGRRTSSRRGRRRFACPPPVQVPSRQHAHLARPEPHRDDGARHPAARSTARHCVRKRAPAHRCRRRRPPHQRAGGSALSRPGRGDGYHHGVAAAARRGRCRGTRPRSRRSRVSTG